MELVFLGAHGAIPVPDSGNASFLLRGGNWSVLADTSGNPVQALMKAGQDPLSLDCVVLTHTHTDHLYGLPSLIHTLWMMKREKPLTFLAGSATEAKARELLSLFGLLNRKGLFPLVFVSPYDLFAAAAGVSVRLFPVSHSVPTDGFFLEAEGLRVVYTADTGPLPSLRDVTGGADTVIHESSGTAEEEPVLNAAGHSSARQAAETAKTLDAKVLFLCHAPSRVKAEELLVREAENAYPRGRVIFPEIFRPYGLTEAGVE
jgi:ribonuclease Z